MGYISSILNVFPKLRPIVGSIMIFLIVVGAIIVLSDQKVKKKVFTPYAAKVVFFYTENTMRGGIYYQEIKLDNGITMIANAFSSNIRGNRIRLIDLIAVGDSVERNTWGVITVYRDNSESYVFTHNPEDFMIEEK